jgi:CHAP domain
MNCRKRENWCTLALFVIFCSGSQARNVSRCSQCDLPANSTARSIHDEAMRVLNSVKLTEYRHKTDIDEKKGAYYCDCSGFVGYVLNRTVAKDDTKGPFHDGRKRPLARDYEKGFAKAPEKEDRKVGWQQVTRLTDARPGDVIAWRHEKPKPNNTGHVVIVDQTPVVEEDGLIRVGVIDSTTLPSSDLAGGKGKSGIGRRTMWFTVDKDGEPKGYVRGSRTSKPKVEAISVGRALPALTTTVSAKRAA